MYCNEGYLKEVEDPMEIMMSFWAQLNGHVSVLSIDAVERAKLFLPDGDFHASWLPSREANELKMNIICKHIEKVGPTTLILDGLDECGKLKLRVFDKLKQVHQRTSHCRVLIASRPEASIIKTFE